MRNPLYPFTLILVVVFLAGFAMVPKVRGLAEMTATAMSTMKPPEPLIKFVESPQLAEVILKPPREIMGVSRDPFGPLIADEITLPAKTVSAKLENNDLRDLIFVGLVKFGEEYFAYLKTGVKTGVYKLQDKVGNYAIEQIDANQVVFKSGENVIVKKRGKI